MNTSDWLAAVGVGISAITLVAVGFGAIWLQHNLENLRLKREVFRRVVGNAHGILFDCQDFKETHAFNEAGITAINEIRAAFPEKEVHSAWSQWYASNEIGDFVSLIHAMSIACKLRQYEKMRPEQVGETIRCSCLPVGHRDAF